MMTVHEVSKRTGASIRALHHYDKIGLLPATEVTATGYRLYDDTALERLQYILLFKELEFPLKDIRDILDSPAFDREKALTQQLRLLELKKERLEGLIHLARGIQTIGVKAMDFDVFTTEKIDEYAARAKASWGNTEAYREFEERAKGRTKADQQRLNVEMMAIFAELGKVKDMPCDDPKPQELIRKLQEHISSHYYTCTDEILLSLGQMYAAGGEFTENIDRVGGKRTAAFACMAVKAYCQAKKNS